MRSVRWSGRRRRPASGWCPLESLEARLVLAAAVWDGGPTGLGTDWHDPQNWKAEVVPADGDDITIGPGPDVTFSTGSLVAHAISVARKLKVSGGTLGVATTAIMGDAFTLDGGAISGGQWTLTGPGLAATSHPGNAMHGVSLIGHVSLDVEGAFIRVTGGLTVTGLISISGDSAAISFDGGNQALSGVVDVLFSGFEWERYISVDAGAQLTIAPTVRVSGDRGALVSGRFSGSGVIINQGTIWADTEGGKLDVRPSLFSNLGTLRASNFAQLRIGAGSWTNTGLISTAGGNVSLAGTFDVTGGVGVFTRGGGEVFVEGTLINTGATLAFSASTGTWRFNGGTIVGGTITVSPTWFMGDYPSSSGKLVGVTVVGDMAWQNGNFTCEFDAVTYNGNFAFGSFGTLVVRNTLTFNGTWTVTGAGTLVQFAGGNQSLMGNIQVHMRHEDAYFWSNYILTIPAAASISGYGNLVGSMVNLGSVMADIPGKRLLIGEGDFDNQSVVGAAGGKLWIGLPSGSAANFINRGTFIAQGASTVAIGPTLDAGPVVFDNRGTASILGGSHLIVGTPIAIRPVGVKNSGMFILGEGSDAKFGDLTAFVGATLENSGVMSIESGAIFSVETDVTTAGLGDLRAAGGTVRIRGDIDNSGSTLVMDIESGSWMMDGSTLHGGVVSSESGSQLVFNSNLSNRLQGVTLQGSMSLGEAGARVAVSGGLTLQGEVSLTGDGAALWFDVGAQALSGNGTITLSGLQGVQTLTADRGATVTIGSGISVVGLSGTARVAAGVVGGGTGSFVNNGTIAGKIQVSATSLTNNGTMESRNGQTLVVTSALTNVVSGTLVGGNWKAMGGSTLQLNQPGIVANDAAITLEGVGASMPGLAALDTNRGSLTLTNGASLALSSGLLNLGGVSLGPGGTLQAPSFYQGKRGQLSLQVSTSGTPHLDVAGHAWLFGSIAVSWTGTPVPGSYSLIQGASVNADVQSLVVQSPGPGLGHLTSQSPTAFRVVVFRLGRP